MLDIGAPKLIRHDFDVSPLMCLPLATGTDFTKREGRKAHCLPLPAPQRRGVLQLIRAAPRIEGAGVMPDDQSQRRGVLQLIRAAPRAEGTVSALSACKALSAASRRRSGRAGGRSNGPSLPLARAAPEPAFRDALELEKAGQPC